MITQEELNKAIEVIENYLKQIKDNDAYLLKLKNDIHNNIRLSDVQMSMRLQNLLHAA